MTLSEQPQSKMDEKYPGTRGLSFNDLARLRVDGEGRLLWDGHLVQVQRRVTLSFWQLVAAVIVTVGAASQGMLAGFDFACRLGWLVKGCAK